MPHPYIHINLFTKTGNEKLSNAGDVLGCLLVEVVVKEDPVNDGDGDDEVEDGGEGARELVLGGLSLRHSHWPHLNNNT